MNALANHTMFQSAYRQITAPERAFVDSLVNELHNAARRQGASIRLALNYPLPDALRARDTRGWLDRPLVRAAINEQVQQRAHADEISPERWIEEVQAIATANIKDILCYDEAGDPYFDLESAPTQYMAAVKSVEIEKSDGLTRSSKTKVKVTMHPKGEALKMWQAYLGLDDGDNAYRKADRDAQAPRLPADVDAQQAGDTYAAMIGD